MKIISRERWKAIINDHDYILDEKQAKILQDTIASGNRGIVQFEVFMIPIPFLQEFYLEKIWEETEYTPEELAEQNRLMIENEKIREERYQANKKEWDKKQEEILKARKKLEDKVRLIKKKPMTQIEFKKRREELLKQAKNL